MLLKLLLLLSYVVFIFLLGRLLETASLYQDTKSFFTSIVVMDPLTLSVKKLKQLLDNRGVNYSGVVEKQELVELVESSGQPTKEELIDAEAQTQPTPKPTQFELGIHFYEEVEDTMDSAWLVQVVMEDGTRPLLSEKTWKEVQDKIAKYGVRSGIFKCSFDSQLCKLKGWTTSRLILALPLSHRAKEDVVLHTYQLSANTEAIFQWVRKQFASRVRAISSESELEQWMTYSEKAKKSGIRVIFFSFLKTCPMFLSALAIKFNGRVKFAMADASVITSYKKHIKSAELPVYLVITSENTYVYGSRRGECYNFKSMELFLKTFVPEINDAFLWSLAVGNILASFELFFMYSQVWKHVILWVLCVAKYNGFLFFFWLLILGIYNLPIMNSCTDVALRCLRFLSSSNIAALLRSDYKCFYSYTFIFTTFTVFALVSGYLLRRFKCLRSDESMIFSTWWEFLEESSFFFRPMASPSRPASMQDLEMEAGMELFIERLAVPNFWLQPVISMDYIKNLPVWKYQGWCEADDRAKEVVYSSDEEASKSLLPNTSQASSHHTEFGNEANSSQKERNQEMSSTKLNRDLFCDNCVPQTSTSADIPRAPKGMLEFRECSICLENYHYSEVLCGLPCGHNFHMNCILSWISRDNHCCPICRWPTFRFKGHVSHLHSN